MLYLFFAVPSSENMFSPSPIVFPISMPSFASKVAHWERIHLPMQETSVPPLARDDPLEKEMATHPSILAWEIP